MTCIWSVIVEGVEKRLRIVILVTYVNKNVLSPFYLAAIKETTISSSFKHRIQNPINYLTI